jgi:hypothetical protein
MILLLPFIVCGILSLYFVKMRRLAQGPNRRRWAVIGFFAAYVAPHVAYMTGIASSTVNGFYRTKAVTAELASVRNRAKVSFDYATHFQEKIAM